MLLGLEIIIPLAAAGAVTGGVAAYQKKKYDNKMRAKTFKKPLMEMESDHLDKMKITPLLLTKLLTRIDPDGLKEERVFAVQGNPHNVQRLRKMFNTMKEKKVCIDLEPFEDICSLLKVWLRQLPAALIPIQVSSSLFEVFKSERTGELNAYKEALMQLPDRHYECLRLLLTTLHSTWTYSGINGMNSEDLAQAFGPFIIHEGTEKKKLTEEEQKAKKEAELTEKKRKKEEEKKKSKEEKASGKEKKRIQEAEMIAEMLQLGDTDYEEKAAILPILQILIEHAPNLFVEKNEMPKGKKSKRESGYSRK